MLAALGALSAIICKKISPLIALITVPWSQRSSRDSGSA